MSFVVKSVTPSGLATLRVTYSFPPRAQSASAVNDALNPDNYALAGPATNYVIDVVAVAGDTHSVDCFLAAPLAVGAWTLTPKNIVDSNSIETISGSFNFAVSAVKTQSDLNPGTQNDAAENVLRKFFNPGLKGPNWDAILTALAAGDTTNWENAKLAFDQLFITSASDGYLDQRTGDQGIRRPRDVGMTDDLFRQLAISVKNHKLTVEALLEVLEVFYGRDAVMASSTSDVAEPYDLRDLDDLEFLIDEKQDVTMVLHREHFAHITSATALEVAAAITRGFRDAGSNAFAISFSDPTTGESRVRVYAGSLGLSSSVRVIGGRAQRKLRFPTSIFDPADFAHPLSVQLATTGPLTPSGTGGGPGPGFHLIFAGSLSVDGTVLVGGIEGVGTRVLLKDQADPTQNGIFHCAENDLGGHTLYRDSDFWTNPQILTGQVVHVTSGATNAGRDYQLTSVSINIDVLPLVFQLGVTLPIPTMTPTTWHVSNSPDRANYLRFVNNDQVFEINKVQDGDLVYIFGDDPTDPFRAAGLQGLFDVSAVTTYFVVATPGAPEQHYFEIFAPDFANFAAGITQTVFTSLMFFRPTKRTVYDEPRRVVVAKAGKVVKVVIPATTSAVARAPGTGAYLNTRNPISISSLVRSDGVNVTVQTGAAHGLSTGDQVIVDGVLPDGNAAPVDAGTPSGAYSGNLATGITDGDLESRASESDTFQGTEHQALRLREGEIMIVGGQTQVSNGLGGFNATAITHPQVFDVQSESVSAGGGRAIHYRWQNIVGLTYTIGRRAFGACALSQTALGVILDDRILLTGGVNGDDLTGTPTNHWDLITYIANPSTQSILSGTMPAAFAGHAQATLMSYELVCGGWTTPGTPLNTSYAFDHVAHTWSAKGNMARARMKHQLTCFTFNSAIFALASGGKSTSAILNFCEIYQVNTNTWRNTGQMTYARYNHAQLLLPDGRIMVFGGTGYNPTQDPLTITALKSTEIWDPNTEIWCPGPAMLTARDQPVAVYMPTLNSVVVSSGAGGNTSIDILDLATMKWTHSLGVLGAGQPGAAAAYAANDTLLIAGGTDTIGIATPTKSFVFVPNAESRRSGGLNRRATVATVPDGTHFTYKTSDQNYHHSYVEAGSGATVTPSKAPAAPAGVPGPFTYDPAKGLAITSVQEALSAGLSEGQHYSSISLATSPDPNPALQFPDAVGYVAFNVGFDNQVGPVKYLGRLSASALLLDASFVFPATLAPGATVTLLSQKSPFQPAADVQPGNFYVTSSAAGRVAAEATLQQVAAAGLDIEVDVVYPSDRGLGAEGFPTRLAQKLSDAVPVWGGDDLDNEIPLAREGED